jgi:hypothetical protein
MCPRPAALLSPAIHVLRRDRTTLLGARLLRIGAFYSARRPPTFVVSVAD